MVQDERPEAVPDPLEERLRRRLRYVAGYTLLGLVTVLALAYTFGGEQIRVEPFIFGSLIGSLLLIAGVEAGARLLGNGRK